MIRILANQIYFKMIFDDFIKKMKFCFFLVNFLYYLVGSSHLWYYPIRSNLTFKVINGGFWTPKTLYNTSMYVARHLESFSQNQNFNIFYPQIWVQFQQDFSRNLWVKDVEILIFWKWFKMSCYIHVCIVKWFRCSKAAIDDFERQIWSYGIISEMTWSHNLA